MKCLSRTEIQEFIDKESDPAFEKGDTFSSEGL